MQRLLADAQKLSGVEYNIDNLNDVYEAIHVVQGELEISGRTAEESAEIYERTGRRVSTQIGTTAREASSTLSGSLAAMKAAFSNVLGKLTLGQDIGPALNGLAQTVTTFLVGNLLPAVWNILTALPGALAVFIQTALPQLTAAFMEFLPQLQAALVEGGPRLMAFAGTVVEQFCQGFPTMLPRLIESGQQLLSWLINGITTALPQLLHMALRLISTLSDGLIANLPQIIRTGTQLLMQLISGIRTAIPNLLTTAAEVILNMATGLIQHFPEILAAGFDLIVSLIQGIGNAFPDILAAAGDVVRMVWDTIKNTDWIQLGKDIIQGMIDGIGAMGSALWEAAKKVASSVLDSIKEFFGIASPSRVMRDEVGRWIPAGVAQGITANLAPVRRAMLSVADLASNALPGQLSAGLRPAYAAVPAYAGGYGVQHNFTQNIYTHDSLSPAELTREAENFKERSKWQIP